jgi:hypothetical protein
LQIRLIEAYQGCGFFHRAYRDIFAVLRIVVFVPNLSIHRTRKNKADRIAPIKALARFSEAMLHLVDYCSFVRNLDLKSLAPAQK